MEEQNKVAIDLLYNNQLPAIEFFIAENHIALIETKKEKEYMYIKYTFRKDFSYPLFIELFFAYRNPYNELMLTWWSSLYYYNRPNNKLHYWFKIYLRERYGYSEKYIDKLFHIKLEEVLNLEKHNEVVTTLTSYLKAFFDYIGPNGDGFPIGKFQSIMDHMMDPNVDYPYPGQIKK